MAETVAVMPPSSAGGPERRRIPTRLLVLAVVALAAFGVGFLAFDVQQSRVLVRRYGYYTIALTFAWALVAWARVARPLAATVEATRLRERWQVGAVIVGCALVAVLTTPVDYKILYDEMVLQATASNMHQFREVSTVMRAYHVDGVFVPLDAYVDKRPFFYAFLVSVLHDLTGYREGNAFAVNVALMPVVLAQLYLLMRRFGSHVAGLAAVVALGTLSTFAHSGTGAGMEMLNLAMILLVAQLGILYLEKPTDAALSALVLAAVLLAQTRYESSLYVGPVALVAIEGWRRAGRVILPPAAILAPALLIPYAVHNTYLSGTPMLWELHEEARTRFALQNLGPNLAHAAKYFFNLSPNVTNSLWLSAAGMGSVLYATAWLALRCRHWRRAQPAGIVLPLIALGVAANLGVLMIYYWGQLDDPTVTRLILPAAATFALAIGFAVDRIQAVRPRLRAGWITAAASVTAYLWSGLIANAQHTRLNTLEDEISWERRYVASLPPGERLIITNKSALPWMISRVSAIGIDYARRRVDGLRYHLEHATFRDVLVCQKLRPTGANGDFQVDPPDRLPDWFTLEPLIEKRFGARIDRVSRLVAIGSEPPGATSSKPDVAAASGGSAGSTRGATK